MSRQREDHQPNELAPLGAGLPTPPELRPIEQTLASLAPAPPRVDRDRLMFLAGQASVISDSRPPTSDLRLPTHRAWLWPASTAALAATLLALAVALLVRTAPTETIVYRDRLVTAPAAAPQSPLSVQPPAPPLLAAAASRTTPSNLSSHNYLRTRDVALRHGLDALGTFPSAGGDDSPVPTYRSLLDSFSPARPRAPREPPESTQM